MLERGLVHFLLRLLLYHKNPAVPASTYGADKRNNIPLLMPRPTGLVLLDLFSKLLFSAVLHIGHCAETEAMERLAIKMIPKIANFFMLKRITRRN